MKLTVVTVLFLAACFLFFSCEHGPMGIYYSLEVETDLEDNDSLENSISVGSMAKVGTAYYIGAGAVFTRSDAAGSTWTQVSPPDGYSTCTELTESGGALFAVYSSIDGSSSTLFIYSGGAWSEVSALSTLRCDTIASAEDGAGNDVLFAGIRETDGSYTLFVSDDNGNTFTVSGTSYTRPIGDVVWVADASESPTGEFAVITGTSLLSVQEISPYEATDWTTPPDTSSVYGGLYYSGELHILFITTEDGYVHAYTGTEWLTSNQLDEKLFDMEELYISDSYVIVTGAVNGYYEIVISEEPVTDISLISPGVASGSLTTNLNYLNTTLADNVVNMFFTDTVDGDEKLFAGTSGDGLWVNIPQGSYRVWGRE